MAKYTDAQRANDYKIVFGSPVGEKVLTDILVKAHVFKPVIPTDPIEAARIEGARALALHIASFKKFDAARFIENWRAPEEVT
jgi:hypothetical protein